MLKQLAMPKDIEQVDSGLEQLRLWGCRSGVRGQATGVFLLI